MNIEIIPRVKEIYESGQNIIQFLRDIDKRDYNTIEDILISYDFQAGSYVKFTKENHLFNWEYTSALAWNIQKLGKFNTVMEVGCGESTVLGNVAKKLPDMKFSGFDISWSRVNCGNEYLKEIGSKADLFVADLFNIPLADNSIDVVYTSHSIEPNGGREKEALQELYRVASKYLVLLEPTNEFASEVGKERMKKNGYVQDLKSVIEELGYDLIEYKYFGFSANPVNPTGLYIIRKEQETGEQGYHCPISKELLKDFPDHLFSPFMYVSYPKIMGIPCLCTDYAILTAQHP